MHLLYLHLLSTYQFFSLAEYTEVRSGNCTSASVDDCELIATIVGKSFATTSKTKGIYPAGCYTYSHGSQVTFNRNEDDQPSNCTTSLVCFCVPEMGKQRSSVFPTPFLTAPVGVQYFTGVRPGVTGITGLIMKSVGVHPSQPEIQNLVGVEISALQSDWGALQAHEKGC